MKSLIMVMAVSVALTASLALADGPVATPTAPSIAPLDAVCNLTDQQKQQVATIDATLLDAVRTYRAANDEKIAAAQEAVSAARKAGDAEALATAQANLLALLTPLAQYSQTHHADLMAVLTTEQKARWDEHMAVRQMKSIFGPLKLTDQQIAQIKAAYQDLIKDTSLTRTALLTKLATKITTDILTDKQKARYAKATKPGPYGTKRL